MTSGFLFLILFLIATRKPSLLDRRLLTVVALGCAITAGSCWSSLCRWRTVR